MFRRGVRLLAEAIREHPKPFAVAVSGATVFAGTSVGLTFVLGRVTDQLIVPAFKTHATGKGIEGAAIAIIAVTLLKAIGVICRRYYCGMTSFRMQATWRYRITDTYLAAPLSFHTTRPTGELMAHADNDALSACEAINPMPFSLSAIVIAIAALVMLAFIDPILALVAVVVFPVLAVANQLYTNRIEAPSARVQARFGDVAAVAHESFDGALVVKTLGLADHETERLATAADRLRSERLHVGYLRAAFEPGLGALPNLGVIALLALGSWRISHGALNTGQLVEAMALFGVLTLPMRVLGYMLEELPRAVVSVDRLHEVLATEAAPMPAAAEAQAVPPGPVAVQVDHVSFAYEPGVEVLDEVSFAIEPGEVLAVTGATAAGKSTLCLLLGNLMPANRGSIELNGVPLPLADPASVGETVASVFQDTFLFADTVEQNLVMGTSADAETVAWAAQVARADRFVAALPDGLQTVIGERGVTLSGGQRQRLALARALVRRPRLLLLDDATSAVDPRVEQQILDGLRHELDVTTVIVAHRVSTIALADRVLFLDEGRVAAMGSHADLLATVPAYAALVRAYEDRDEEADADDDDLAPASGAGGGE
jgi:ABC-type multidrug transport system fused ATPase/permease subunit